VFHETFHHLVHHTLDHAFNQVAEFLLQKQVELIALPLYDLCEIVPCQDLEVLMRIDGTFGMFGTFSTFETFRTLSYRGCIRDAQAFAPAEHLQGLQMHLQRYKRYL
jgi:hypothetical protein